MNKKLFRIIVLFFNLIYFSTWAQEALTYKDFISQIYSNHPIVKQADFVIKQAEGNLLATKGAFDPSVSLSNDSKTLDEKTYFNYYNSELSYQTPFAVKLKTGLDQSRGSFINPELTNGNLGYFGVELPLLKGLLLDYKRTELKNANLFVMQTEEEKRAVVNDLVLDASLAYFQWAGNYTILKNVESFEKNAEERLRLIRITFQNGDRAMIDTVEALTQLQNIRIMINEAQVNYFISGIELAKYLWDNTGQPFLLNKDSFPDTLEFERYSSGLVFSADFQNLIDNHPDLRKLEFGFKALEIYRKFKLQNMLPELNLRANALSKGYWNPALINSFSFNDNYKFGFNFKVPLLLREARGEYKMADFKVKEMEQKILNKRWEIQTKASLYETEKDLVFQKVTLLNNLGQSYEKLLNNEELKLKQGESTLFLINSREQKLLENKNKLLETKIKFIQVWLKQKWSLGLFTEPII
jgi:outer membrane protein TolC